MVPVRDSRSCIRDKLAGRQLKPRLAIDTIGGNVGYCENPEEKEIHPNQRSWGCLPEGRLVALRIKEARVGKRKQFKTG